MENDLMPIDSYAQGNGGAGGNSTNGLKTVKTLGIVSIVTSIICCWIYGIPGLVTGIIGLVLANQEKQKVERYPENFYNGYLEDIKSAKTLNIIGICISGLTILALVVYMIFIFAFAAGEFDPSIFQ